MAEQLGKIIYARTKKRNDKKILELKSRHITSTLIHTIFTKHSPITYTPNGWREENIFDVSNNDSGSKLLGSVCFYIKNKEECIQKINNLNFRLKKYNRKILFIS